MALTLTPWFWVVAFVAIIITIDRNVEDWIALKLKHLLVWFETQKMKRHLLMEIKKIESDFGRYDEIARQLLEEFNVPNEETSTTERNGSETSQDPQ